jgi:spore maturation protein CgeB
MDDFNVKIYKERFYDHRYEQALRSGRIGFNCSLMHDITLRVYEIMACGLPLVTDYPSYMPTDGIDRFRIREVLGWAYTYPRPLFRPYHTNFSLDYKIVKARVQEALESIEKYPLRLQGAKKEVWEHHTWRARAQRLVEMVEINLL